MTPEVATEEAKKIWAQTGWMADEDVEYARKKLTEFAVGIVSVAKKYAETGSAEQEAKALAEQYYEFRKWIFENSLPQGVDWYETAISSYRDTYQKQVVRAFDHDGEQYHEADWVDTCLQDIEIVLTDTPMSMWGASTTPSMLDWFLETMQHPGLKNVSDDIDEVCSICFGGDWQSMRK
jgi:hypothetical protein